MGNQVSFTDLPRINTKDTYDSREEESAHRDSPLSLVIQTDLSSPENYDPSPEAIYSEARRPIHNRDVLFGDEDTFWDQGRRVSMPDVVVDREPEEQVAPGDFVSNRAITEGVIKLRSHYNHHISRDQMVRKDVDGTAFLVREGNKTYICTVKHNFFWTPKGTKQKKPPNFPVDDTFVLFPRNTKPITFRDLKLQYFSKGHPPTKQDISSPLDITKYKEQKKKTRTEFVDWRYGFDVVLFEVEMCQQQRSMFNMRFQATEFELPEQPFGYAKGMRVGIVVWDIRYSDDKKPVRLDCLGEQRDINVYRGEILEATDHTIECSYNSYSGCSGAPILSLDMENYPQHFGRVIAVHAGNPGLYKEKGVNDNVAFRLVGKRWTDRFGREISTRFRREILTAPKTRTQLMWAQHPLSELG